MAAIHPIRTPAPLPPSLDELVNQWIEAKRDEDAANMRRVSIEQQIIAIQPAPEEGSSSTKLVSGLTLTVKGALRYSADMDQLLILAGSLPEHLRPLKTTTTLDETGAKHLRRDYPEAWAVVAPAITIKPAKVAVSVKV
jgi:hypothetical protein